MSRLLLWFIGFSGLAAQTVPQGRALVLFQADAPWPVAGAVESIQHTFLLTGFEDVDVKTSRDALPIDMWMTSLASYDAVVSVGAVPIKEKTQFVVTVSSIRKKSFPKKEATYTANDPDDIPETLERMVADICKAIGISSKSSFDQVKKSVHVTPNMRAYESALTGRYMFLLQSTLSDSALTLIDRALLADGAFVEAIEWRADVLLRLRRYDDALAAYNKILSLDPKRTGIHEKIADVFYYFKDDIASALSEYLKEREIRPMATGALVQAAYCQYLKKEMPLARRDVEAALAEWRQRYSTASYAPSSNALNLLGLLAMTDKDTTSAIRLFTEAASVNPAEVSARRNLARIFEIQRQIDRARQIYRELVQIDPTDAFAHLSLANIEYYRDKPVDAALHFASALVHRPALENARENPIQIFQFMTSNKKTTEPIQAVADSLGDRLLEGNLSRREEFEVRNAIAYVSLYYLGKTSDALGQFQILQASPYATPRLIYYMAEAQYQLGQYQSALTNYERYSSYADDSYNYGRCYLQIGKIHLKQNEFLEAQLQITKSVRIYPNAESAYYLGIALRANQELDKSRGEFERAIRIFPGYIDAYVELGKTLMAQEKLDSTVIVYMKAAELDSTRIVVLAGLAEAQLKKKEFAAAEQTIRRAIRQSAIDQAPLHSLLGQALLRQNKIAAAATEFEKERRLDSTLASPYYNIASVYAVQKKKGDAVDMLQNAFERKFRDFERLDKDTFFDPIRQDPTFKKLVELYRQKFQQEVMKLLKGN